ncbi:protein-(glutamine-N5) methyltransferase, release factor-specific [Candidatus Saccharibacteria bacterium]|nr:MAG: protein-(glutamine-N5) methyltransferase, release factor-specific [Candidatus Saccharibacteria bacterium]
MPVSQWLADATAQLQQAGIGTARLDSLILLEDTCKQQRSWLLAHPEHMLNAAHITQLNDQLRRRAQHEPLAYIRGITEFYGRTFTLTHDVLEPRPESETMIELLLSHIQHNELQQPRIIDVGTGSGALAITSKLELPHAVVTAIDIDPACLVVAKRNARQLQADVNYLQGDLLQAVRNQNESPADQTFLLANLPYVPDDYQINQAALQEPHIAIFGGPDGLDHYRRLFEQAASMRVGHVFTEALPFQHQALRSIAMDHGYQQATEDDFIQHFRFYEQQS